MHCTDCGSAQFLARISDERTSIACLDCGSERDGWTHEGLRHDETDTAPFPDQERVA